MNAPDSEGTRGLKAFQVPPEDAGARLDQWLAAALGGEMSRSRVQGLIRAAAVTIDGKAAGDAGRRLAAGATVAVSVPEPEPAAPQGEAISLDILFEDDQLLVINKPAGLVVHPGAGNPSGTLVNALIHHCGDSLSGIGGVRRPGIVHRLDKDTSGVMVVAKTDRAHQALSAAFADHGRTIYLERAYQALVWGAPHRAGGTVDAPLGRASTDRTRRAVVSLSHPDARRAVTHFSVLDRYGGEQATASLLECRLETGRTHQIRVHMAHIGHPLVGDAEYGQGFRTKANKLPDPLRDLVSAFPRQALHAGLLGFGHPLTGREMQFEAPLPADMAELVAGFRRLGDDNRR